MIIIFLPGILWNKKILGKYEVGVSRSEYASTFKVFMGNISKTFNPNIAYPTNKFLILINNHIILLLICIIIFILEILSHIM